MTSADYADDLALFANTPAEAESLLHSPERAAGDTDRFVNANKTELICFKQEEANFTLSIRRVHIIDSNISSTESDVNLRLTKSWTAIDQ